MQRIALSLIATVVIAGAALAQRPQHVTETKNGKPVHDIDIMFVTPGDLEAFYGESDDIVEVTITGHEARIVREWPRTFYTATVTHTYKGNLRKDAVISFSQFTGEVEFANEIRRTNGQEPLAGPGPFVVFLKSNADLGGRTLVGDRSGAFLLRQGRVEPQAPVKALDAQRNVTLQQFSEQLARIERHARPKA